ncbi:MAG: hypothetical protein ABSH46_12210 [Bryobacteraceae bacterium]|jgi:hypothetical protein
MEIHPPEKPIHTVKDFLLQLLTITVGILIALSLEGAIEWSHHRSLVSEAKENLRQEILDNKREIGKFLAGAPDLRKNEEGAIQFIEDLRAHRAKGHHKLDFSCYFALLSGTSWGTAQAAGAVAYMPYRDVQSYAGIYDKQRKFDALQDRLGETIVAAVPSEDPDNSSPRALGEWKQHVQTSLTYLHNVEGLARSLRDEYDGALR